MVDVKYFMIHNKLKTPKFFKT